jgi:hypothetical protein
VCEPESRISLGASSKKTFRFPFQDNRKLCTKTGKWAFRVGSPSKKTFWFHSRKTIRLQRLRPRHGITSRHVHKSAWALENPVWRIQKASKPCPSCLKNRSRNRKLPGQAVSDSASNFNKGNFCLLPRPRHTVKGPPKAWMAFSEGWSPPTSLNSDMILRAGNFMSSSSAIS